MLKSKRSEGLGLFSTIAFSVGSMIGAGVFILSGMVINIAGSGAVLSYVLCGILVMFSGLSYASLASVFPSDGGGYLYSERMLGKAPGFLVGWGMYYFSVVANAFVLIGFGIYFNLLVGTAFDPRILALVALVALTLLNLRGLSEAGKVEVLLVSIKVAILLGFVVLGIAYMGGHGLTSPSASSSSGFLNGIVLVFFAYTGFQVASMMAGEVRESSKMVPLAILLSIAIVMVIYTLVILTLLSAGLQSYGSQSVYDASVVFMGALGGGILAFAATVSTISSANAGIVGSSRVIMSMASEGMMPGRFAKLRKGQPSYAIILGSEICAAFIIYGNLNFIVDVTNVAVLSAMFLVNLSAISLWRRKEDIKYSRKFFKIPFGPLFPAIGAVSCIFMLVLLTPLTLAVGLLIFFLGLGFYLLEDTPHGKKAIAEIKKELDKAR